MPTRPLPTGVLTETGRKCDHLAHDETEGCLQQAFQPAGNQGDNQAQTQQKIG